MVMTYTSLVNQVISYLDREGDVATSEQIPNFIYQAQQRLALACKTIGLESYVVGVFIPGQSVYQKPANWRRNISMNVGSGAGFNTRNPVLLRTYEFLRSYTPNSADVTKRALPQFYSDYGFSNYLVAPTPDQAYPYEYAFLKLPDPVTDINQTNWWTNFAPQVLLNATLLEAMYFLKDDDRIQVYKAATDEGIQLINTQDDMRIVDRSSARQSD
jgi:hypothetical protein